MLARYLRLLGRGGLWAMAPPLVNPCKIRYVRVYVGDRESAV